MPGIQGIWDTLFNKSSDDRFQKLEAKVDRILDHLGLEAADLPTLSEEVKTLALQPRKKFAAVKLHRAQTGVGLAEAEASVAAHIRTQRTPKRKAKR